MLCYLVVTSGTIIKPRPSNSINLVEEDEARFLGPGETVKSNPRKKKMFSDLAISKSSRTILAPSPTYFCTNSDPITLQDRRMPFQEKGFQSPDETGISPVGDRSRTQGFASARGAVQQNTLRRLNSKVHKALGVEEGSLHNLEWN